MEAFKVLRWPAYRPIIWGQSRGLLSIALLRFLAIGWILLIIPPISITDGQPTVSADWDKQFLLVWFAVKD
jgi:hypothetical protein